MPTYYKHGKLTTAFNCLEIDRTASYNPGTALTATFAIDNPPGEVLFRENPQYKIQKRGHLTTKQEVVSYGIGNVDIPEHPVKTGLFLMFGSFTAATATTTHTLVDLATGPYEFALHGVQMHTTTAQNVIQDALGCKMKSMTLKWGQDIPLSAAYTIEVAEFVDGNNTARKTTYDAKLPFVAGQVSYNHVYNSTSFGATILGGEITIDLMHKYNKGGNKFPTEAVYMGKDFKVSLQVQAFNKNMFDVPNNPGSYASAITFDVKFWRSNKETDFIQCSFTNLKREPLPKVKKIDEAAYIWEGSFEFTNSGTTQGNMNIKWADPAISGTAVAM